MPFLFFQSGHALRLEMALDGEVQVNAALTKLLGRASDFEPAWKGFTDDRGFKDPGVEEKLRKSMRDRFSSEGKPEKPWPELTEATNIDRARHGYPREHPILIRSGQLIDSLTVRSHPDHIFDYGRMWMEVGTHTPYAIWHQRPQAKKRRPMLYINKKDFVSILSTLRKHLRNIGVGR
jgi:phage gpG-like protein